MRLKINYDLMEKVRQANGQLNLNRNVYDRIPYVSFCFGLYTVWDLAVGKDLGASLVSSLRTSELLLFFLTSVDVGCCMYFKESWRDKGKAKLDELAGMLRALDIETSRNKLMQAEEYDRTGKLILNAHKLPVWLQSKYILVPTYNEDVSLLQEHVIGSKQYYLSKGSPARKIWKLAHA